MKVIEYSIKTGRENMNTDAYMLDKAIMQTSKEPVFRLYGWSPRCISLGRNQNEEFTKSLKEQSSSAVK